MQIGEKQGGSEALQDLSWVYREFQRQRLLIISTPMATLEVSIIAQTRVPLNERNKRSKVYFVTKD